MIITVATNADEAARQLRQEIRAFRRAQRLQMRRAGNLVKRAVEARLASGSPLRSRTHKGRRGKSGKQIGPLVRSIRLRIIDRGDGPMVGMIRPAMRGFYGRFHERGLDATSERRVVLDRRRGRRAREVMRSHRFRLPPRPFLEPTARATRNQVLAILGDSFNVFQGGRAIGGVGGGDA